MKKTRPPRLKSRRTVKTAASKVADDEVPSPGARQSSAVTAGLIDEPISISGMLQVASAIDPAAPMHYPVAVNLPSRRSEFHPAASVFLDWFYERVDQVQSFLLTTFTRRVPRQQAVRRNFSGRMPSQARRTTERRFIWNLRRLVDRLINARTPWRYVPWSVSVVLAVYFIWRGPSVSESATIPPLKQRGPTTATLALRPEAHEPKLEQLDGVLTAVETGEDRGADAVAQELSKVAAEMPASTSSDPFKLPAGLRPAVAFWQRVFGVWGAGEVVLHDSEHLGIVYRVVDLPQGAGGARLTAVDQRVVDQQKQHLCATLNDLEYRLKRRQGLTQEQTHLLRLITLLGGKSAVRGAAERVRVQRGMRNSFRQGLAVSGRYEKAFRRVFRENGLPEDLVYLVHVESAFTSKARSPAGAVGVWQFMPETGRRFLRINQSLDERYDPVLATRGAARYFALAYDKLGDWGLAVTSFNHGLTGMLNAKAECGINIECIVQRYDAPTFGFASRNYYAEFLAIRSIVINLSRYFPDGVNFAAPLDYKRIRLARSVPVQEVARAHGLGLQDLVEINPAWTSAAAQGRVALPVDADIWIPENAVVKDAAMSGLIARIEDTTTSLSR